MIFQKTIGLKKKKIILKCVLTVLLFLAGIVFVLPLLWMISTSLKKPMEVFQFPIKWIPDSLQFINYKTVWTNKVYSFYLFYWNSIKISLLTIIGALFVCSTAAYSFAKVKFKGRDILFIAYLATMMIPTHVTLVPRFMLFYWLGIYDTHWALILPAAFYVVGIFMLRQFYLTIPIELSEAAVMDGAGHLRIWWKIIIPLSKPALTSLAILIFVFSWSDYINPLIFITSKELYTIPMGIQIFLEMEGQEYHNMMAAATSAIIPVIIVFLILQKYFIQGIVTSGLKG